MKIIIIYLGWIIVVSFLPSIISILFFPLLKFFKKNILPYLFPLLSSSITTFITTIILIKITLSFNVSPTYLMFLLSWVAVLINALNRINKAEKGKTRVERMVGSKYDSTKQIRFEYLYLLGDMIGIWIPIVFLNKITFL